jgi:hypothetical protein
MKKLVCINLAGFIIDNAKVYYNDVWSFYLFHIQIKTKKKNVFSTLFNAWKYIQKDSFSVKFAIVIR